MYTIDEVNGMQPDEEERGASYLACLFGSDRPSATYDDDSDFVDPPVSKSKKFNTPTTSIPGVVRNSNVSKKTKSVPKEIYNPDRTKLSLDLKSDIRTLHREIDAKLDNFMDELRTKVPSNQFSNGSP
ncbi:hypothetical protein Adt_09636 [Abeliophyllum distichum]|uniref:Uncharacterized protein n=1 Tax=Abeliophyllum distichum TaxID=126358 RepID=A0ABD1UHV4_9LAMI